MPPTLESLSSFPWTNAVLQIPTQEFGILWATETLGPDWQIKMPFLRAVVKRKMWLIKMNGQQWIIAVECDNTELKWDAKYLYDRIKDQAYLQELQEPKLPVSPAAVAGGFRRPGRRR